MQWNVLCINRANATTSQDVSTISFDRETPGNKYRRKGRGQGGRRLNGRSSRYQQNGKTASVAVGEQFRPASSLRRHTYMLLMTPEISRSCVAFASM